MAQDGRPGDGGDGARFARRWPIRWEILVRPLVSGYGDEYVRLLEDPIECV